MIQYENTRDDLSAKYLIINPLDTLTSAGSVTQALDAAISNLDSVKIAVFPPDELFDFRAQRPIVEYHDGKLAHLITPELRLSLVTDIEGENFLYLSGQEPDYRWERVTADLIEAVRRFKVREVISFAAMPAAIPHTRPADMLLRSTSHKEGVKYVQGKAVHPGALADFFEYYAGKLGISVVNIRVRVPFYLAQLGEPFLAGALAALRMTANLGGPKLPLGDLERYEDRVDLAYRELLGNNPDLAELIVSMENEYDLNPSERAFATSDQEIPQVPSVEEIGLAAEKFLAVQNNKLLENVFVPEPQTTAQIKQKKRRSAKFFGLDFALFGGKRNADTAESENALQKAEAEFGAEAEILHQTSGKTIQQQYDQHRSAEMENQESEIAADSPENQHLDANRGKHHFES